MLLDSLYARLGLIAASMCIVDVVRISCHAVDMVSPAGSSIVYLYARAHWLC